MNFKAIPIEGSIIDLPIDPRVALRWVTNTPGGQGGPIKQQVTARQPDEMPKDLGEERHHQLISAIKGLKVSQTANQTSAVTDALRANRDWR